MNTNFKYKTALITGGSSGIGLKLAEYLLEYGLDVFLVGLDEAEVEDSVEKLIGISDDYKVVGIALDLRVPEAVERVHHYCREHNWEIDLLVNCAGYARSGMTGDIPFDEEAGMIELHGISYLKMTRMFLPDMQKNNHGCIVNLSSISAFQPNPTLAVYGASKAFVFNWSLALRAELKSTKSNIQVQTICPTPVLTNFQKNAQMENSILFDTWMTVRPELVAREIIRAIKQNKAMIVPGRFFHYLNKVIGLMPLGFKIWLSSLHLKTKK